MSYGTLSLLLLTVSASLSAASTTTWQTQGNNLTLCNHRHFNEHVYIATSTESDAILAQLDIDIDNATEKMKELAKLNVTRRVCDVLATHNTEKKVGGKALEDTVLEDALLMYHAFKGLVCNTTTDPDLPSSDQCNTDTAVRFLHNYCLYWFGKLNASFGIRPVFEIRHMLLDGHPVELCPTTAN